MPAPFSGTRLPCITYHMMIWVLRLLESVKQWHIRHAYIGRFFYLLCRRTKTKNIISYQACDYQVDRYCPQSTHRTKYTGEPYEYMQFDWSVSNTSSVELLPNRGYTLKVYANNSGYSRPPPYSALISFQRPLNCIDIISTSPILHWHHFNFPYAALISFQHPLAILQRTPYCNVIISTYPILQCIYFNVPYTALISIQCPQYCILNGSTYP